VIAARTGLMAQGLTSAKGQDFKELSLMSSEKTEALSASADAMAASAGAIGQRLGRVALDEGAHALRAAAAVAQARTPAKAAEGAAFDRSPAVSTPGDLRFAQTLATMKAQAEALAPIHKTATANAKRLRKTR